MTIFCIPLDPFSTDRLLGQNLFGLGRKQQSSSNDKSNVKGVSDSEILLGAELFRRQQAEQQRRRRPGNANGNAANSNANDEYYRDYDYDFLYYLYKNRFRMPTDYLYYRYNLFKQPTTTRQSASDVIFDPIDPSTPEFFDYDYDVNVNGFSSAGTPTPSGVLPEQAVALANSKSRKARLWRKVYYLQYLRELYRRTYADYYNDYYYGIQGSGNYGRLTKKTEE